MTETTIRRAKLDVELVGLTFAQPPLSLAGDYEFSEGERGGGGTQLAEFAGRACYQSWNRPNPKTATNEGYLDHILDVGHLSVLEHGVVSFYITGVSRSLTHELVRHRHLSFSQLSQRYVPARDVAFVIPPDIEGDQMLENVWEQACRSSLAGYNLLLMKLEANFADVADGTERRKKARQAARSVLPNCVETKIVVTGNLRAWRHFIDIRATRHADVEIRALAVRVLRELQAVVPNAFNDYEIITEDDGTESAFSHHSRVDG